MSDPFENAHKYFELTLGEHSRRQLLTNLLTGLGFEYTGPESIEGRSGVKHAFEAVGLKDRNVLLVVGGAEQKPNRHHERLSQRERMELWRNQALFSVYDIQEALAQEGRVVDLLLFHNVSNRPMPSPLEQESEEWVKRKKLFLDMTFGVSYTLEQAPVLTSAELAVAAQAVGACFFSLDNLEFDEIAKIARRGPGAAEETKKLCQRLRLAQYFAPPTDEMLLTAYDLSRRRDKDIAVAVYDQAVRLGHQPTDNVLVSDAPFRDPVATAVALEKHKYIDFKATVEMTPEGTRVTQEIRKTAQGSLIVRILKEIGLPALARAIIAGFKGTPTA